MKKLFFITTFIFAFSLTLPPASFAQGMMGFSNSSPDSTALQSQQQEEQEGKKFLDDLGNKTVTCLQLNDANFEKLGEYFMSQAIGDTARHIGMNGMMKRMMGDKGEEQMHTAWGKRGSGCDGANQSISSSRGGENSMMNFGGWNNMMGGWGSFGILGWALMLLFWTLLILSALTLFHYLSVSRKSSEKKTALEILKERYAQGEIGKKEFEEKKRDVG